MNRLVKSGVAVTTLALIAVSIVALAAYPGDQNIFLLFCAVFVGAWALAWFGYQSYFYIWFSSLNLLGFWMKACAHLLSGREFIEPTGSFDGSGGAWDSAIVVALVAGLGMLCFRLIQMYLMRQKDGACVLEPTRDLVPIWYPRYRKWIWGVSLVSIAIVAIINFELGINQAGLLPKNHLPFKLNAIIIWCLYSAFAFWIAALAWWDVCLGMRFKFEALVFEGILSSITVLSRSLYITHVAHYFFSILFNKNAIKLTLPRVITMASLFVAGMVIVLVSVAELRKDKFYGAASETGVAPPSLEKKAASTQFMLLLSERWIGLEGVMSTSSYSGLGADLFREGWLDMPSYKSKPVYERVANSIYIDPNYPNADKYNFLSTPGLAAMLHLSGSLTVVALGVFLFMTIFFLGEYFILSAIRNPFVLSLYGIILAMMLHQFGGLYVNLIQLFEIGSMMIFLWGVKIVPEYFRSVKSG